MGSPPTFSVTGTVIDRNSQPLGDMFVQAFDSDFGSADDYLGNAFTDTLGKFEIRFEEKSYKSSYDILERNPDIYLVISDSYGIVHKTDIHSNAASDLDFGQIRIIDSAQFDDPYANAGQRMVSLFAAATDSIDTSLIHPVRSTSQMLRSISSWLHYTDPRILKLYGCPGPQVIARPREVPNHDHTVVWEKKE